MSGTGCSTAQTGINRFSEATHCLYCRLSEKTGGFLFVNEVYRSVVQVVERLSDMQKVNGANPFTSTFGGSVVLFQPAGITRDADSNNG